MKAQLYIDDFDQSLFLTLGDPAHAAAVFANSHDVNAPAILDTVLPERTHIRVCEVDGVVVVRLVNAKGGLNVEAAP